jgi:hypothetical protein
MRVCATTVSEKSRGTSYVSACFVIFRRNSAAIFLADLGAGADDGGRLEVLPLKDAPEAIRAVRGDAGALCPTEGGVATTAGVDACMVNSSPARANT